ncbi:protocadherin gamma-B1-like [Bombina bombina]|uniref:protocadherin gamma-B1-like n=1 Tax=Bombina bombina TaxID=8345 RepID=UPI00235AF0DA|nr:protocadherin gamma-B1-like [Bombina bombina]
MADLTIQQAKSYKGLQWQVLFSILFLGFCHSISAQLHYSIFEEMKKGSIVGNIAKDLGLNIKDLSFRKVRIVSRASEKYFTLNVENGNLYVKERLDRETLCGADIICLLTFDVVVESPLNVFHATIEIQDINDNAPRFFYKTTEFEIVEFTSPGARFALQNAQDPDVGSNSVLNYRLSDNQHFILSEKIGSDGSKTPELVLEKPLDREIKDIYDLTLTAADNGSPIQTGDLLIKIIITDVNDNIPIFTQDIYKVTIKENTQIDSTLICVHAADKDDGINGEITYSFSSIPENALNIFDINPKSGEIKTNENLDFEEARHYEISVQAKDGGGLVAHCKLLIEILDVNDNAPDISITSMSTSVPEDSLPGTVVALIEVHDQDSGDNSVVDCQVIEKVPFTLIISSGNYYKIVTTSAVDRETAPSYNITILATDKGLPSLSSKKILTVEISDINDNAPVFLKNLYIAYIPENNPPGSSIYSIYATDLDIGENAKLIYSICVINTEEHSTSSYLSINPVTGVLYSQCSFDYEEQKEFYIQIMARDSGSPPLSSNATLKISIVDLNDNVPEILYPMAASESDSTLIEMVPLGSEEGSLVSKVVAVDADSGHNAWLSYHFIQVSEPSLFTIDHRTGEIRTSHALKKNDILRQRVIIMVKDNGNPYLSATVTLNLFIAEHFYKVLPELSEKVHNEEPQSDLKIYLAIALALISFLFILTIVLVIIFRCKHSKSSTNFGPPTTNLYSQVDPRLLSQWSNGTLPPYSYNVCVALDSSESDYTFRKPVQNVPVDNLIDHEDSTVENETTTEATSNNVLFQCEIQCGEDHVTMTSPLAEHEAPVIVNQVHRGC